MKNLLIIVFAFCSFLLFGQNQRTTHSRSYKVIKIDTVSDFYLIFLNDINKDRYTIYSKRTLFEKGIRLEVDSTYLLELSPKILTLPNGVQIPPRNYLDIEYFPGYSSQEIGMLCTANHLNGLFLTGNVSDVLISK